MTDSLPAQAVPSTMRSVLSKPSAAPAPMHAAAFARRRCQRHVISQVSAQWAVQAGVKQRRQMRGGEVGSGGEKAPSAQ